MSIDIVLTWPTSMDYPIWRSFIRKNRHLFGKVLIAFMDAHRKEDYTSFVKQAMSDDGVTFVEGYQVKEDWRDSAVQACLKQANAEWIWFTEQDFFIRCPEEFFHSIGEKMGKTDIISFEEGDRIHPACLFVKTALVKSRSRNFGVQPDISDHFGQFVAQLAVEESSWANIPGKNGEDYYHMNGLTHNLHLVADGIPENIYKPAELLMYCNYSRMQEVEQDVRFITLTMYADYYLMPIVKFFTGQ